MRCANCGGELPEPSRFCPHCSAPQPGFDDPMGVTPASPPPQGNAPAVEGPRRTSSLAWSRAYAALVFVAAAIVAFTLMAILFGWIGAGMLGL